MSGVPCYHFIFITGIISIRMVGLFIEFLVFRACLYSYIYIWLQTCPCEVLADCLLPCRCSRLLEYLVVPWWNSFPKIIWDKNLYQRFRSTFFLLVRCIQMHNLFPFIFVIFLLPIGSYKKSHIVFLIICIKSSNTAVTVKF